MLRVLLVLVFIAVDLYAVRSAAPNCLTLLLDESSGSLAEFKEKLKKFKKIPVKVFYHRDFNDPKKIPHLENDAFPELVESELDEIPQPELTGYLIYKHFNHATQMDLYKRIQYFRYQISQYIKYPPDNITRYSRSKFINWLRKWQQARELLIKSNLRLVAKMIFKYAPLVKGDGDRFKKLVEVVTTTAIQAIDAFDFRRNFRTSTYLCGSVQRNVSAALAESKSDKETLVDPFDLKDVCDRGDSDPAIVTEAIDGPVILDRLLSRLRPREREIIEYRNELNGRPSGLFLNLLKCMV